MSPRLKEIIKRYREKQAVVTAAFKAVENDPMKRITRPDDKLQEALTVAQSELQDFINSLSEDDVTTVLNLADQPPPGFIAFDWCGWNESRGRFTYCGNGEMDTLVQQGWMGQQAWDKAQLEWFKKYPGLTVHRCPTGPYRETGDTMGTTDEIVARLEARLAPKFPCHVCKKEIGWDAPSGVCSEECLRKGQGLPAAME